jgi:hypothetical protein
MLFQVFSAIPSWYGYQYQGVLASYYAIKSINSVVKGFMKHEGISNLEKDDIKNLLCDYSIEIESLEDFAIKRDVNYISIHQVKAGKSISKLEAVDILDLFFKVVEIDKSQGYFHVSKAGSFCITEDQLFSLVENKLTELIKDLTTFRNKGFEKKLEYINGTKDAKKGSFKKIFKEFIQHNGCDIKKINENSISKLEIDFYNNIKGISDKIIVSRNDFKAKFNLISEYPEYFSSISDIEDSIKEQLRIYHQIVNENEIKNNEAYLENEIKALNWLIDNFVDNIRNNESTKSELEFNSFIDILNKDLNEFNEDYTVAQYRKEIFKYYNDFRNICNLNTVDSEIAIDSINQLSSRVECEKSCNLYSIINQIRHIPLKKFKQFADNITSRLLNSQFQFPDSDSFSDTIFTYVLECNKLELKDQNKLLANKDGYNYWVFDNRNSMNDRNKVKFLNEIELKKHILFEMLYDADKIITKQLAIKDIYKEKPSIFELGENEVMEFNTEVTLEQFKNRYINIMNGKKIEVIEWEKALEELNE